MALSGGVGRHYTLLQAGVAGRQESVDGIAHADDGVLEQADVLGDLVGLAGQQILLRQRAANRGDGAVEARLQHHEAGITFFQNRGAQHASLADALLVGGQRLTNARNGGGGRRVRGDHDVRQRILRTAGLAVGLASGVGNGVRGLPHLHIACGQRHRACGQPGGMHAIAGGGDGGDPAGAQGAGIQRLPHRPGQAAEQQHRDQRRQGKLAPDRKIAEQSDHHNPSDIFSMRHIIAEIVYSSKI